MNAYDHFRSVSVTKRQATQLINLEMNYTYEGVQYVRMV